MAGPRKPYRARRLKMQVPISGFEITLEVELYSRVKKARNESFTNLAPSGQQVESRKFDPATGEQIESEQVRKGVKVGPHEYAVMTDEALEQIKSGTKTTVVAPEQVVRKESIAMDLAIDRFAVRPAEGQEGNVSLLWNGLRVGELAYCSQVSMHGGHDSVLVFYADENGLWAALLPFEDELYPLPTHSFDTNDQAGEMLAAQLLGDEDEAPDFDHSAFESEYRARRQAAIDAVIAGEEVVVQEQVEEPKDTPDLLAALQAAAAQPKPKKSSAKSTKKSRAKREAISA
jgi:non-homologous end joining protein Ku